MQESIEVNGWRDELAVTVSRDSRTRPFSSCKPRRKAIRRRICYCLLAALVTSSLGTGCYVPLRSPAISAVDLPDEFRTPLRSITPPISFAALTFSPPKDYLLGPNDILEVFVPGMAERDGEQVPRIRARIMADGTVRLPLVGAVKVGGMNLSEAQQVIDQTYSDNVIVSPRTSISLAEESTLQIAVMGEVAKPGVYPLPWHQADVAHAIALAGGLSPFAADIVEVHRRISDEQLVLRLPPADLGEDDSAELVIPDMQPDLNRGNAVLSIPLRGAPPFFSSENQMLAGRTVNEEDLVLRPNDVIVVPRKPDEVFFVVGPLSEVNVVNFAVSNLDRRLGNALLLPPDRDVDVATAVAMAGYIDPIKSPSTVTVHRSVCGGPPLLIRVDLIAARYDWQENIYVHPGDIIYLNPDVAWWSRRTFDRILPDLLTIPYQEAMLRWINPQVSRR